MVNDAVNFVQSGEGAPVILIHGVAASVFDWIDLSPALVGAGYATYALDLLGHGKSIKPKDLKEYNANRIFEHLEAWIESLGLASPLILVGHSLGGYLAVEYALRYPQRVRALVLVDPFYSLDQLSPLLSFHYRRPIINLGLISYAPKWLIRLSIELAGLFIRNGYIAPQTREGRAQTADDYKHASPGIYNILTTVRDLTPELPKVNVPVFMAWGTHDQSLSPQGFKKMVGLLPNARAIELDTGHVPHQSHPMLLTPHILEFLQEH